MNSPIILAMDTNDLDTAKRWIDATQNSVGINKLGLEFFLKFGRDRKSTRLNSSHRL